MRHTTFNIMLLPLFLLVICRFEFCYSNNNSGCLEGERISLLQFKKSLIDRSNRLSSWTGLDCCKWEGVSCSSTTGHVLELDLHNLPTYDVTVTVSSRIASFYCNNCLEGEINQSLINLTHLNYLDLSSNNFSGINIPEFLESFKSLKYLNLSSSGFVGSIPTHLGNLSSLEYLDLGNVDAPIVYNNLATNNLEWLFGLSSLKTLDISLISIGHSENWLNTINKLKFLSSLNLASCNLGTTNPLSHVNSTTSLVWLDLEGNYLDSTIFLWLSNVTRLEHLSLAGNDINSDFPDMFEHLASLKVVDLGWNAFTGTITPLCKIHNLIDMELSGNDFQGLIPNCLGNLTSLISLQLAYNQFEGSIPNSLLSHLCRLQVLDLSGNKLTDFTTVLSGCLLSSLKTLNLDHNNFSGQLPKRLFEYRNLELLSLSSNSFSGIIAESLGNLSMLQVLYIEDNKFSGSIPLNLGELSNLESLDISNNSFTGVLSEFHFSKLNKLDILRISGNLFVWNASSNWIPPFQLGYIEMDSIRMGPDFPHWLRTQRNVQFLSMRNANITNAIPDWFWDLFWNCRVIELSQNGISGNLSMKPHVGVESYMKASVEFLFLSNNQLTGEIPKWLCNLKDLYQLDLSTNKLHGEIPLCFEKLQNLIVLDLGNNNLCGHIPNSLGSLYLLESLHLRNNKLEGEVPSSLQNLGSLKVLDLSENELTDVIQPWIGEKLSNMRFLILHANHLYGDIPLQLCQLQHLQLLNLANNNMSGYIPHCFDNLTGMVTEDNLYDSYPGFLSVIYGDEIFEDIKGLRLQYNKTLPFLRSIDLSGNHLVGMIPMELTSLHALKNLNLSGNHLSGAIPASIGNLSNIESLDLSRNLLSDHIPPSLSSLNFLSYLNLSFNNLYGRIPSGNQLQTLNDPSIYIGNEGLCGAPLPKSCSPSPKASSVDQPTEISCDNHEFFMWFYAGLGPGFFVGFIGVLSILLFKTSWRFAYFKFLEIVYNNILHKIFTRG